MSREMLLLILVLLIVSIIYVVHRGPFLLEIVRLLVSVNVLILFKELCWLLLLELVVLEMNLFSVFHSLERAV